MSHSNISILQNFPAAIDFAIHLKARNFSSIYCKCQRQCISCIGKHPSLKVASRVSIELGFGNVSLKSSSHFHWRRYVMTQQSATASPQKTLLRLTLPCSLLPSCKGFLVGCWSPWSPTHTISQRSACSDVMPNTHGSPTGWVVGLLP